VCDRDGDGDAAIDLSEAPSGGDIGCGMACDRAGCGIELLLRNQRRPDCSRLVRVCAANRHAAARELPAALRSQALTIRAHGSLKRRDAAVQLGTLGRGNNFLISE